LSRDVVDVKKALLAHPLVGQYAVAEQLLDRLAAEVLA
jgi:alpha-galactosidase/6-phospho-beta-glucosidase family protein